MRKLRDLIRKWWTAPRWTRKQFLCSAAAYVLLCAVIPLALMSSCYRPAPRAKTGRASLMCDPCIVPTPSGAVLVGTCDEGWCDELV